MNVSNWGVPAVLGGRPGEGGARFEFRIPIREAATPKRSDGQSKAPIHQHSTDKETLRALVVDDEPLLARTLSRFLKKAGFDTTCALRAEDAIDLIDSDSSYDVILSDIHMPGLGGEGFYEQLKTFHPTLLDRMLFTSGDIVTPDTHQFLERTGRPAISKPFGFEELVSKVKAVAKSKSTA